MQRIMIKELKKCKPINIIKNTILTIMLLLPFLSIVGNVVYQTWNETSISKTHYSLVDNTQLTNNGTYYLYTNDTEINDTGSSWVAEVIYNGTKGTIIQGNNSNAIQLQLQDQTTLILKNYGYVPLSYIKFNEIENINKMKSIKWQFYEITTLGTFDSALQEIRNISTFNWVENTGTYETIKNAFSGLNINDNIIPLLIAYWLLIIAIFLVFNIVITSFEKLISLVTPKID